MNKEITLKAIDASIAKWVGILEDEYTDFGHRDCPLCDLFYDNMCEGCPISKYKNTIYCRNTPYQKWSKGFYNFGFRDRNLSNLSDIIGENRAKQIVKEEINFLRKVQTWYKEDYPQK